MSGIHQTAIIEDGAKIGDGVAIGPYCSIGPEVEIGAGTNLFSHVVVGGRTRIGADCELYPFASVGLRPQDMKYKGEPSAVIIGQRTVIREHVTINPGTAGGSMATRIGNDCLLMVGAHAAHDCDIGDFVIMANNATLGGHVEVGDYAILGGLSAVHQFCRIGQHAMVGGMSGVENDVIPYGSVVGNRAHLTGLNIVGLKRRNFSRDEVHTLRTAYRLLFAEEGTMSERIVDVAEMYSDNDAVMDIVRFIRTESSRAICQPKLEHAA